MDAHVLDELQVIGMRADPARHPREGVVLGQTALHGQLILAGVEEELAGPDQARPPADAVQIVEEGLDLLHAEGRHGLLAVPEGGVGDKDLVRRLDGDEPEIEIDLGHLVVVEDGAVVVSLLDVVDPRGIVLARGIVEDALVIVPLRHDPISSWG